MTKKEAQKKYVGQHIEITSEQHPWKGHKGEIKDIEYIELLEMWVFRAKLETGPKQWVFIFKPDHFKFLNGNGTNNI